MCFCSSLSPPLLLILFVWSHNWPSNITRMSNVVSYFFCSNFYLPTLSIVHSGCTQTIECKNVNKLKTTKSWSGLSLFNVFFVEFLSNFLFNLNSAYSNNNKRYCIVCVWKKNGWASLSAETQCIVAIWKISNDGTNGDKWKSIRICFHWTLSDSILS